jgi:plastocyanin
MLSPKWLFAVIVAALCVPHTFGQKTATDNSVTTVEATTDTSADESKSKRPPIDKTKSILKGRVKLKGTPPGPRKIQITKDPEICSAKGATIIDTVIGKDAGVANVIVVIQGVKTESGKKWDWQKPKGGYVLRQKDCAFKPYMIVVPRGENITVHNEDPVSHNVNTGQWNVMQAAGSGPIVKPVSGKSPFKIGCNVHSWMEGWIYPVDNPFYALTDKNGKFEIVNIPPGKYRVSAWHSNLGRKRVRLELKTGETKEQEFEYVIK